MKLLIGLLALFTSGCVIIPAYDGAYSNPAYIVPNPVVISNNYVAPRRFYPYGAPVHVYSPVRHGIHHRPHYR